MPTSTRSAILIADRVEVGIVQRLARPMAVGERGDDPGARRGVVGVEQVGAGFGQRPCRRPEDKVGGAKDFILSHRQSADELADPLDEGEGCDLRIERSEEHTSELQSLMRISYAVFCL